MSKTSNVEKNSFDGFAPLKPSEVFNAEESLQTETKVEDAEALDRTNENYDTSEILTEDGQYAKRFDAFKHV
jgi:hypothetical protein